jgi:assimilatory nitrate reductase catalytic subunit
MLMATLPKAIPQIIDQFGPHLNRAAGAQLDPGVEPDAIVKTHCCFCGQQCGIQLLVKDNSVIGFEPWMDFPFNQGKLCPKGVKRYLQGAHPDRLLHAYERDPAAPGGFRPMDYQRAIERVAAEIGRIQSQHGRDAFAILSGASLTIEKAYLMGKFARMCLRTANIDYNGRLCMVSAAAGNKKAFGIDRGGAPWTDILTAEVIWISGANIAECAPITTDYVWQAREYGAKIIVVDPRVTPIGRTADLHLAVRPGTDAAFFNAVLHVVVEEGLTDEAFLAEHTTGWDEVRAAAAECPPGSWSAFWPCSRPPWPLAWPVMVA